MEMNIRLIATDLDGTLLNNKKEIPEGFFTLVEKLYERNVRMVIASGRQYFNLVKLFAPIKDKLIFLCENGSLLFDGDEKLFCGAIPPDMVRDAWCEASAVPTASVLLCGAKAAYLLPPLPVVEQNARLYYEKRIVTDKPLETALGSDSVIKIAVFDSEDAAKNCEGVLGHFRPAMKLALAGKNWLDFMRADVNKGAALRVLRKRFGLEKENCMAFGDYPNDLEMFDEVYYSYAMANSHPDVLRIARFHAPDCNEDGVMRVLREYFPE